MGIFKGDIIYFFRMYENRYFHTFETFILLTFCQNDTIRYIECMLLYS